MAAVWINNNHSNINNNNNNNKNNKKDKSTSCLAYIMYLLDVNSDVDLWRPVSSVEACVIFVL